MDPTKLPPSLRGKPFTILGGTTEGASKSRMLRGDLARPTYGVRSDGEPTTLILLAQAVTLALPGDIAFSHETAAGILDLPLPQDPWTPLHVMRDSRFNRIRRAGCQGHLGLQLREVVQAHGLSVASTADTFVDLAAELSLDDLVVLGDAVARRDDSVEGLLKAVARRGRVPERARTALGLVRVGSDSAMETKTRLVFHRGGLPAPELNAPVLDAHEMWIATGDFVWRQQRVVAEYQGETHFGDFAHGDADISRRLLVQDHGWRYVEITKLDIFGEARRHQLVERLARWLRD